MIITSKRLFLKTFVFLALGAAFVGSCKKLDIKRIAVITTLDVENVTESSVTARANIIDKGEYMTNYGFCWSTTGIPDFNSTKLSAGSEGETGEFSIMIASLEQNTSYSIRSYIVDELGITYGDVKNFKTLQQTSGKWFHYDDGVNFTGIGFPDGGTFDVAIRFPKESLQDYQGYRITRVRFVPLEGTQTEYYVTIWEGDEPPDLVFYEIVPNPSIGSWTEHELTTAYPINTGADLWVGYWVFEQPADTYPAGVDKGPATTGYGDLISTDDGETWEAISVVDPTNLNYNWNLQFFIEDGAGKTVMLSKDMISRNKISSDADSPMKANNLKSQKRSN